MTWLLGAWIGGMLALGGAILFGMRCAPGFYSGLLQNRANAPLVVLLGLALWPLTLLKFHLEKIPDLDGVLRLGEPRYRLHNPREEVNPPSFQWVSPDPMTAAEFDALLRLNETGRLPPVATPAVLADLIGCLEHPRRIHDGGPCAACLPDPQRGPDGRLL